MTWMSKMNVHTLVFFGIDDLGWTMSVVQYFIKFYSFYNKSVWIADVSSCFLNYELFSVYR